VEGLMQTDRKALSAWPRVLFLIFAIALFAAERLAGEGGARVALDVVAGLSLVCALGLRALGMSSASEGARRYALFSLGVYAGGLAGALLYAGSVLTGPDDAASASGRLSVALLLASIFVVALHVALAAALEVAVAPMRQSGFVEMRRISHAAAAAATAMFAIGGLAGLNFAMAELKLKYDFASGGAGRPSDLTVSMIQGAEQPVEVYLFYETGNPALPEVEGYFDGLADAGAVVRRFDHAVDPELAEKLKVTSNGTVGFKHGERVETYYLGTSADLVKRKNKRLDREVRKALAKITQDQLKVYFTVGHGERGIKSAIKGSREGMQTVVQLLENQNAMVDELGIAEGLGTSVPDDADLVIVAGPTNGFLPEEAEALRAYAERGGAILILLDPGVRHGLDRLLDYLALEVGTNAICHDREFVKRSRTVADHAFIFASSFTSHKSVGSLRKAKGEVVLLFLEAAELKKKGAEPEGEKLTFLARSRDGSFEDKNRNRVFDTDTEVRQVADLVALVEPAPESDKSLRAVVIGDSDILADTLMQNEANQVFGFEITQWLLRDDVVPGPSESGEDVQIRHSRDEDVVWFYGTTFVAPLLVLVLGVTFSTLKRRRRSR